jgi:hypothetical protein
MANTISVLGAAKFAALMGTGCEARPACRLDSHGRNDGPNCI